MQIAKVVKQPTAEQMRKNKELSFLWNLPVGQTIRIKSQDLTKAKKLGFVAGISKGKLAPAED